MELKQIIAYSLLDYSIALVENYEEGWRVSDHSDYAPRAYLGHFSATLLKEGLKFDEDKGAPPVHLGKEVQLPSATFDGDGKEIYDNNSRYNIVTHTNDGEISRKASRKTGAKLDK